MKKLGFLFALIAVLGLSTCAFAASIAVAPPASADYAVNSIVSVDGVLGVTNTANMSNDTPITITFVTVAGNVANIKSNAVNFSGDMRSSTDITFAFSGPGKVTVEGAPVSRDRGDASFKINSSVANFEIKEGSLISADTTITGGKFTLSGAVVSALTVNGASAEVVITKGEKGANAQIGIAGASKTTTVTNALTFLAGGTAATNASADVSFDNGLIINGGHATLNKSRTTAVSADGKTTVVDIDGLTIVATNGYLYVKDATVNVNNNDTGTALGTLRMAEAGVGNVNFKGGTTRLNLIAGNLGTLTLTGGNFVNRNNDGIKGGKVVVDAEFESTSGDVTLGGAALAGSPKYIQDDATPGLFSVYGGEVDFVKAGAYKKGTVVITGSATPTTTGTVVLSAVDAAGGVTINRGKLVFAAANAVPKTPVGAVPGISSAIPSTITLNGGTVTLQKPQEAYRFAAENPVVAGVAAGTGLVNLELTWGAGIKAARRGAGANAGGTAFRISAVDVSAVKVNKGDKFAIFEIANTTEVLRNDTFRDGKFEIDSSLAQDFKVWVEDGPLVPGADKQYEWQKVWLEALKDGPNPPNEDKLTGTLTGATSPVNFTAADDSVTVAVDWKINGDPIPPDGKVVETFSITPNGAAYFTVEEVEDGYKVTAKENGKGGKLVIRGEYPNSAVNYEVELAVNVAIVEEPTDVSSPSAEQTTNIINPAKAIAEAVLKANSDITYKILPSFAASGFSDGALVKVSEVQDLHGYWGEEGFYIAKIKADGSMTNFSPAGSVGQIDGAYAYDSTTKMLTVYIADNSTAGFDLDDAMGAILDPIVVVKDGKTKKDSSGGGCNTAYAPFALLLVAPLFFLRKKD